LQQETNDIQSHAADIDAIAAESGDTVVTFQDTLSEFSQIANNTAKYSNTAKLKSFITSIKADHILFKAEMYKNVIYDDGNVSPKIPHQECRLGKWQSEEGKKLFGNSKSFKNLAAPHKIVHDMGNKNLTLTDNSLEESMVSELVQNSKEMEKASDSLFEILDMIIDETTNS
jgi:hypothetical protein